MAMLSVLLLAALPATMQAFEIEAMKHDIQQIPGSKFDTVIGKFRDSSVAALWFFKDDSAEDKKFLDEYNKVASDLKGMAKIAAVNCNEFAPFCKKNNVKETPAVMIYPINPMPAFLHEGKMEAKSLTGKISKWIPDYSLKLTDKESVDTFLTSDTTKPKIMLFSSKKTVPTMFKALSSETVFKRSIKFAFITEEDKEICARFKVTKFPTVLQQPANTKDKPEQYKGELNFIALKDWVNLHSESGMGDKVSGGGGAQAEESIEESKPWLVQEVPELTGKSQNDICFKGEGLCVIYLADGDASQTEMDMLSGLSKKFTSQLSDRGAKMKWMWMNLKVETAFKDMFEPTMMPSAVVFNPHKRLRFAKLDHGEDNDVKGDANALTNLMDKVLGGDARFKMVPGQKLPSWAQREAAAKKKTEL